MKGYIQKVRTNIMYSELTVSFDSDLIKLLSENFPDLTESEIEELVDSGWVKVGDESAYWGWQVYRGELVTISRPLERLIRPLPDRRYHAEDHLSDWIGALPINSLAGPEFTPSNLRKILDLGTSFSVNDAQQLAKGVLIPSKLSVEFNTITRSQQLIRALERFHWVSKEWLEWKRHSPLVTWVLQPPSVGSNSLEIGRIYEFIKKNCPRLDLQCKQRTDIEEWLPFLSFELIDRISSLSHRDYSILRRLLLRASLDNFGNACDGPWRSEFPSRLLSLSVFSLYAFEPTNRSMALLKRLNGVNCSNIGHLRALHPSAWQAIKAIPPQEWRAVHVVLATT